MTKSAKGPAEELNKTYLKYVNLLNKKNTLATSVQDKQVIRDKCESICRLLVDERAITDDILPYEILLESANVDFGELQFLLCIGRTTATNDNVFYR